MKKVVGGVVQPPSSCCLIFSTPSMVVALLVDHFPLSIVNCLAAHVREPA